MKFRTDNEEKHLDFNMTYLEMYTLIMLRFTYSHCWVKALISSP